MSSFDGPDVFDPDDPCCPTCGGPVEVEERDGQRIWRCVADRDDHTYGRTESV